MYERISTCMKKKEMQLETVRAEKDNRAHRKIFPKHIIGKVNGNLVNPIHKSINGKAEFFPFMENLESLMGISENP